jgi:hypothetical protein
MPIWAARLLLSLDGGAPEVEGHDGGRRGSCWSTSRKPPRCQSGVKAVAELKGTDEE